jgi:hypothetical protein
MVRKQSKIKCRGCNFIIKDGKVNIVYLNEKLITLLNNKDKIEDKDFNQYKNSKEKKYKLCNDCYNNISKLDLNTCNFCRHNCSVNSNLCSFCEKNNNFVMLDNFLIQMIFKDLIYLNIKKYILLRKIITHKFSVDLSNNIILDIYQTIKKISLVCSKFNNLIKLDNTIKYAIDFFNENNRLISVNSLSFNNMDTIKSIIKINNLANQISKMSFGICHLLEKYSVKFSLFNTLIMIKSDLSVDFGLLEKHLSVNRFLQFVFGNIRSVCSCDNDDNIYKPIKIKIKEYKLTNYRECKDYFITKIKNVCTICSRVNYRLKKEYLLNGLLIEYDNLIENLEYIHNFDTIYPNIFGDLYYEYETR